MFKLIPDWRQAWRYPSVVFVFLALLIQSLLAYDPHSLDFLPDRIRHIVTTLALLYATYDRLKRHEPEPEE